jgi:hypothetical protein
MMHWSDRRRRSQQHAETDKAAGKVVVQDKLISILVLLLSCLAWACAMFVPVWKVVDTSYLFRVSLV